MNSFDEQIKRMKALCTYGNVSESKNHSNYAIEYHTTAADGKEYGIIRECNKFYIKSCPTTKSAIAEAYAYIGGEANKTDYMFESYDSARKFLDLKMKSINEAQGKKSVVVEALDPFKVKGVEEGTEQMMSEIARMRQIMANTAALMNESAGFGSTPFNTQPEAAHGHSGDKDTPFTEDGEKFDEQDEIKTGGKPEDHGTPFGDGGKAKEGEQISVDGSVASMHPSGGKVARVNESEEFEEEPVEDTPLDGEDLEGEEPVEEPSVEGEESSVEEPTEEPTEGDEDEDDFDFSELDFLDDEDGELDPIDSEEEPTEGEDKIAELKARIAELEAELAEKTEEPTEGGEDLEGEEFAEGDEEYDDDMISESARKALAPIIRQIAESIIAEDELHVWGQHPGYRKKPMTLPATGEDKNAHGEDINDSSVHNEEPFGKSIGDGMPFNLEPEAIKDAIAESIVAKILGKKKVN